MSFIFLLLILETTSNSGQLRNQPIYHSSLWYRENVIKLTLIKEKSDECLLIIIIAITSTATAARPCIRLQREQRTEKFR